MFLAENSFKGKICFFYFIHIYIQFWCFVTLEDSAGIHIMTMFIWKKINAWLIPNLESVLWYFLLYISITQSVLMEKTTCAWIIHWLHRGDSIKYLYNIVCTNWKKHVVAWLIHWLKSDMRGTQEQALQAFSKSRSSSSLPSCHVECNGLNIVRDIAS